MLLLRAKATVTTDGALIERGRRRRWDSTTLIGSDENAEQDAAVVVENSIATADDIAMAAMAR